MKQIAIKYLDKVYKHADCSGSGVQTHNIDGLVIVSRALSARPHTLSAMV